MKFYVSEPLIIDAPCGYISLQLDQEIRKERASNGENTHMYKIKLFFHLYLHKMSTYKNDTGCLLISTIKQNEAKFGEFG